MIKYTAPELNIVMFDNEDIITMSTPVTETTAEKVTGGGGGVVLPDDSWD